MMILRTFLRFLDKYVSQAVGHHTFARWKKSHQTKTLLDTISVSDIAYTILVCENSKEVWEEEIMIKAQDNTDEEKKRQNDVKIPSITRKEVHA